jgi:uncharacterized damage-inducible protein DinB
VVCGYHWPTPPRWRLDDEIQGESMTTFSRQFLDDSRAFLIEDYLPKIERCATQLTQEQIWSRSNDASNSIGNLMLHLAGSSRYWAVEVIGGTPIGRVRQREFDQREPVASDRLLAELRAAVAEVERRLSALPDEALLETRTAGEERLTVLWCVYHIVEHFSMHTGQILSMTKALVGEVAEASR